MLMDFSFFLSFIPFCQVFVSTAVFFHCLSHRARLETLMEEEKTKAVTRSKVHFDKEQH